MQLGGSLGTRDIGLLESAVAQAQWAAHFSENNIFQIASVYCYCVIKNHPFVDGNKRTGILAAITFLNINGYKTKITFDELYYFALNVAQSKYSLQEIADFFEKYSSPKYVGTL